MGPPPPPTRAHISLSVAMPDPTSDVSELLSLVISFIDFFFNSAKMNCELGCVITQSGVTTEMIREDQASSDGMLGHTSPPPAQREGDLFNLRLELHIPPKC